MSTAIARQFWQCSCNGIRFFTGRKWWDCFIERWRRCRPDAGAVLTAFLTLTTSVLALAGAVAGAAAGAGPKYRWVFKMCWRFFIWKVRRNSSLDSIARTPTDMVAACITGSSVKMDSTPFGYLASTSGSKYNSLQVFDKLIVLCDIVWIVQLWPLRIYRWGKCRSSDSRRQTLVERLIHKVCPELDANLARMLFVRVYETSPCTPLLFPLRKPPKSPRDDELAERLIFLPSNPPVRSAGLWSQASLLCTYHFSLNGPCHECHVHLQVQETEIGNNG